MVKYIIIVVLIALVVLPVAIFLCMKYGTVGFYKGKDYMKKNENRSEGMKHK